MRGLQQRRNSFEDGVAGTTCPIPPGGSFTYCQRVRWHPRAQLPQDPRPVPTAGGGLHYTLTTRTVLILATSRRMVFSTARDCISDVCFVI
jgi:hypothetical protein